MMKNILGIISTAVSVLFAASALGLAGCAGNRSLSPSDGVARKDTCKVRVEENAVVPGVAPAKVIKRPSSPLGYCFTETGMLAVARAIACDSGYALASLVNIQPPSMWTSPCFRARLEFYSKDSGAQVSPEPVVRYDTILPTGLEVLARLNVGGVMSGPQSQSGLVNDQGDTATTSKVGFYLGIRYYFLPYLGLEAETGGAFGSADAPQTKSMNFTKAWSTDVGLSLIPWQRMTLFGRVQAEASGGLNYTRLAFDKDFADFIQQHTTLLLTADAASGFGWYTGGGFRLIQSSGLLTELGMRYMHEYPKFPAGTKAFAGSELFLDLAVGYHF